MRRNERSFGVNARSSPAERSDRRAHATTGDRAVKTATRGMRRVRARTLADAGELGWIAEIARTVGRSGGGRDVLLGIGDDAALLRARPGEAVVVSTDAIVAGVHFDLATQSPRIAGARALLVSVSDLSAMGARPLGAVVAMTAPASLPLSVARGLLRGLVDASRASACPLVGGNMARGRDLSLALTVIGAAAPARALRRGAARAGDSIFVTGALGAASLAVARARVSGTRIASLPPLRLAAGRAIGRLAGRGACIDLSDGLLADLRHVLDASAVGARIDARSVPRAPGLDRAAARAGLDPLDLVLGGGEDYELLFTLRPGAPPVAALSRRLDVQVTRIGVVEARRGLRLEGLPARRRGALREGWSHF